MRKKSRAGNMRTDSEQDSRATARKPGTSGTSRGSRKSSESRESGKSCESLKTSAGETSGHVGSGASGDKGPPDAASQAKPSAGTGDGSAAGASRSVDRRALRRILTWLLETTTEQQSLILSAMDVVSGPPEGSAHPNDRSTSPGAKLRATLAEHKAARLHPPPPPS